MSLATLMAILNPPSLILLDRSSARSTVEVLRRIRADERTGTFLLFVADRSSCKKTFSAATAAEANAFVRKPVELPADFATAMNAVGDVLACR